MLELQNDEGHVLNRYWCRLTLNLSVELMALYVFLELSILHIGFFMTNEFRNANLRILTIVRNYFKINILVTAK